MPSLTNSNTGALTSQKQRYEKMNRIVIQMTLLFIGLTLPIACASSFFAELAKTDPGLFVIVFLDCISFTYHGGNFAISYFSNTIFRNEVKRFFTFKQKTPVIVIYSSNQNS
jgi:hypothetical protein